MDIQTNTRTLRMHRGLPRMSDRPSRTPLPGNPRSCVSEAPARNHSQPSGHSIPSNTSRPAQPVAVAPHTGGEGYVIRAERPAGRYKTPPWIDLGPTKRRVGFGDLGGLAGHNACLRGLPTHATPTGIVTAADLLGGCLVA
jgi:hypothetical protein